MKLLVHASEVRAVDVGVDLRGRDVGVAQELLQNPQVGATHQHVRRKAVPEHVRMNVAEPRRLGVLADDLP